MAGSPQAHVLWHGTTRERAESIRDNSPDAKYQEPGGQIDPADIGGFSTAVPGVDCPTGNPRAAALGKANLFPDEGEPVILEIEVPDDVFRRAIRVQGGEVRFQPGDGLEELRQCWPSIPKRIIPI